jgi:hypothetical protein
MVTQIAEILSSSRATLIADAAGVASIAVLTLGLLYLPAFV